MNKSLFLNSIDSVRNSESHDITIAFTPQLALHKNKNYCLAVDSVNMSYSQNNVSANYNNNTLK